MKLENVELVGGQVINAHPKNTCMGYWCCVHYASNHHMRDWDQYWREDKQVMERICEHGIGHPDPDDSKSSAITSGGIHGCDGCCDRPYQLDD